MRKEFEKLKRDIKSLKIQGAKEIAIESLKFFRKYCKDERFLKKFEKMSYELEKIRPTAVVLHNVLEKLRKELTCENISQILHDLIYANENIAKMGYKLIPKNSTVMVYCHSSEDLAVIKKAYDKGRIEKVFTPETRPKLQGLKSALELSDYGIPVVYITDNARGYFIEEVDVVAVGSDAMRKEGNVNKIGTFTLALLSKHFKKPFYVVGDMYKLDFRKEIVIEERDPKEVVSDRKILQHKNITIRNPAFDITPWRFVTKIITDKGIKTPQEIKKLLKGRTI